MLYRPWCPAGVGSLAPVLGKKSSCSAPIARHGGLEIRRFPNIHSVADLQPAQQLPGGSVWFKQEPGVSGDEAAVGGHASVDSDRDDVVPLPAVSVHKRQYYYVFHHRCHHCSHHRHHNLAMKDPKLFTPEQPICHRLFLIMPAQDLALGRPSTSTCEGARKAEASEQIVMTRRPPSGTLASSQPLAPNPEPTGAPFLLGGHGGSSPFSFCGSCRSPRVQQCRLPESPVDHRVILGFGCRCCASFLAGLSVV